MQHFALPLLAVFACALPLLAAQQPPQPARSRRPPVTTPAAAAAVVNLNTATAAELASLPGIGLKTAELIVQYRLKNGPFKKIEEVMNVRGVGEKSFLRIRERVTVAESKK